MNEKEYKYITKINNPDDLKKYDITNLKDISWELRDYMIDTISKIGGHFGSNLGAVELTVALHYVFNSPKDKIIWDVSHQAYPHKIITGRRDQLHTIRQFKGLSGFTKMAESEHDPFGTGHASTSISSALGIACARDYDKENYKVIAVIGDGSMTGGLAYEGLNNCGLLKKDIIVILNDNNMSISPNVWTISNYFNEVISGESYNKLKASIWNITHKYFPKGDRIALLANKVESGLKGMLTPGMLFSALGFRYFGPLDGHNVVQMVKLFRNIKNMKGPLLIHIISEKGKGYAPAEKDGMKLHAVTPFDKITGLPPKVENAKPSYTKIFGDAIIELAENNNKVLTITPAMADGTGLIKFQQKFPDRFFDVGIAEEHAVTFAAGLASKGYKPFVAIYSSFFQRSFDQAIHDVALQNLNVTFVLDRAGLVGADGPTHHGTFDLSYLRTIPGMVLSAPKDENDLRNLLFTASQYNDGPFTIRYPRGKISADAPLPGFKKLDIGKGEILKTGKDIAVLAVGTMVNKALITADELEKENISIEVVNMRFIKPIDEEIIKNIAGRFKKIITLEENSIIGGFGSAVMEALQKNEIYNVAVFCKGIPDEFIEHGTVEQLYKVIGLDNDSIKDFIKKVI
jgi:1-deoxy-D-xylulose-5-phosphate synthase